MKYQVIIFISFIVIINVYPQQQEYITVLGDSLVGKVVEGESVREVYGNVVLTQGDLTITCSRAIQFISRNDAELIGDVIAKQDSLTIYTGRAFYYGNERKAESTSGVKLDDQKVILTADTGDYFFNEDKAFFRHNVTLYDTVSTLTSGELTYYKNENRMVAVNNVKIIQEQNTIDADSLEYLRDARITIADNNVMISSQENNVLIYGEHLEDYAKINYTLINKDPLLVQVDTFYVRSDEGAIPTIRLDTLIIKSSVMEAWRDTIDFFKARDSVKMVRGQFASRNDYTIYYRNEDKIIIAKPDSNSNQPVLWFENTQLTGDSITIYLRENRIRLLDVDKNAFLLSRNQNYPVRFDQISGGRITIFFEAGDINRTEVYGSVLSIYYLYEDSLSNGLTKSSSQDAVINFSDNEVNEVRLYGSPASEYYPENQVEGKELQFTLPLFKLYENRPRKEVLLDGR
jgi:lipopolysaccharide export system protein LptA